MVSPKCIYIGETLNELSGMCVCVCKTIIIFERGYKFERKQDKIKEELEGEGRDSKDINTLLKYENFKK